MNNMTEREWAILQLFGYSDEDPIPASLKKQSKKAYELIIETLQKESNERWIIKK